MTVKISDLGPATLPLAGTEQLELTQDGQSRRVSSSDLASSASGLDATFVTITANPALPNERILTAGVGIGIVDGGPGGSVTISLSGALADVFKVGTPVDNQVGVWTGDGTIEGDPDFTWSGSVLNVAGTIQADNAFGPQMLDEAATGNNPTLIPTKMDPDTGISGNGVDQLFLVAGGVQLLRATELPGSHQIIITPGINQNNAALPQLAFGDADTGFSEPIDDNFKVSVAGSFRFFWELDAYNAEAGTGPAMLNLAAGATIPGFAPRRSDPNTGLASAGLDILTLVAGGIEGVRVTEAAAAITVDISGGLNVSGILNADGAFNANGVATFIDDVAFRDGGDIEIFDGTNTHRALLTTLLGPPDSFRISGAGDLEHFDVRSFNTSMRIRDGIPLEMEEFLSSPTAAPGSGYFWVRNDTPNVPMFTNDNGVDFVLNVAAATPDPILLSSGGAGVPSYSFSVDTNTGMYSPGLDVLGLTVGGVLGLSLAEAGSHVVQTNEEHVGLTASVTQTQAGGLALLSSYNEVATVGTTGDALTAFAVAVGRRLVVINNGANDLQLFPAVGDDFGAGVDTAITIAAGELGIFIGRDLTAWDTLYNAAPTPASGANLVAATADGQIAIWDVVNNQYEPVPSASITINPLAPPTSPLGRISGGGSSTTDVRKSFIHVNIGASVSTVWATDRNGGTPAGFYSRSGMTGSPIIHDWGYWESPGSQTGVPIFRMTASLEFIFNQSAFFDERAAALTSVAARGQVWVRNDVPNVLVYTDDAGTDFVLNAAAPGGGLPLGTVANAALKWDGASAWVEDTQFAFVGGATGFQVRDATLADFIGLNHNGTTAGVSVNAATTEAIFGQGGGPTTAWRFEEMVRVQDGSAGAPGLTFFGGGLTTGFFRGVLGLSHSVGGVEQFRVSNATTQVYSDDFRLIPNLGADSVRMIVNGPSNLNDFEIELTSLIDFHVSGSTGERFVLEEFNLAMVEKSAAPADVATVGQFWVRDDVPNIPMYTDDAGTDKKLGLVNDAVQARRTTTLTLTAAFVDVTLDATDVETDSAVLDHDLVTNTDNIIIGEAGTYEIHYQFNIATVTATNSLIDVSGRVRLNDAGTGIPGSLATGNCKRQHGNDIASHMSVKFIVDLAASDFVTLQVQKTDLAGAEAYFIDETTLQVTRLL